MGGTTERVDGRRARGERKREELIAATLRVVEREGVGGVTHRTVAREAEVSAGSVAYYFATLDDLLVAALTEASDAYIAQLRDLDDDIAGLARVIADAGGPGRARALAERELNLLAARRPALRPVARRWRDAVAEVARSLGADPLTALQFSATADGVCGRLLAGEDLSRAEIAELLHHALRRT
ncbi:TetR/AcrR family transcriptional regulator [Nocardiopsis sp. MG754419]|uniref:TetR/AcrR family transcriptional regulator n=1 Tax=Nocardiopsis sp. MG754419 TaxID=2259865 RepID=UPI001BA4DB16|nr:TetR family transcriptional regulator [Nocardiopsis sp. MG754419]MBR8742383.1 TetR family transcriptional regulator [Nocardiopsis sp. MG754419]